MGNTRENVIDTLKGLGILIVVASHCDADKRMFYSYPFSFSVPLFFMISGYLMSNRDAFFPFVWKKFRRLIISYWIWIILSCDIFLSFFDFTPPNFPDGLWKAFAFFELPLWMFPIANAPLWFLPALFAVSPALYFCFRLPRKILLWLAAALFFITIAAQNRFDRHGMFFCSTFPPALFFGIFGILAARAKDFFKTNMTLAPTAVCLIAGLGLSVGHWADIFAARSPLFFMAAIASCAGWYGVALKADCRFLRFAGKNSLSLLGLHLPLMHPIRKRLFLVEPDNSYNASLSDNILLFFCVAGTALMLIAACRAIERKIPHIRYAAVFAAIVLFVYYVTKSF